MDFILGYEIKLSHSHPEHDICNTLAGRYPKDFVWTGWHPNDICYAVPIIVTEDEYWQADEFDPTDCKEYVGDVPNNFKAWVNDNVKKIETATQRGTLPYFLKDNTKFLQTESIQGIIKDRLISTYNHFTLKEDTIAEQNATAFTKQQVENHVEVSKAINLQKGERMSFAEADCGHSNPRYNFFHDFIGIKTQKLKKSY